MYSFAFVADWRWIYKYAFLNSRLSRALRWRQWHFIHGNYSISFYIWTSSMKIWFQKFNIHINGNFHCCLRYKQLLALHEKIKNTKFLQSESLPTFPPKKLFPLTLSQLENRRLALERYIQFLGQDQNISKSDFLKNFFLRAQIESASVSHESTTLDVYLMNNFHIALECNTTDYSSKVLQNTCQQINVPNQYLQYFSLFFMRRESEKEVVLVRKLLDFESPFISKQSYEDCQIVIRKSYFDPCYDNILMQDKISLNLLFIQTVSDIQHNWIITTPTIKEKLNQLEERGNKKEYLELAKNLPSYDCIKFTNAIVDYPAEGSIATVIIGNRELRLRTLQKNKIQETKFIVTRIKCWRVSTIHNVSFVSIFGSLTNWVKQWW